MEFFILLPLILLFLFVINFKKIVYANEHEASIGKEIEIFNNNFEDLDAIDLNSDYTLGSNHLYGDN